MKQKNYFKMLLWTCCVLVVACEKSNVEPISTFVSVSPRLRIGYQEAHQIAQQGIAMLESEIETRGVSRAIDSKNIRYVLGAATRSCELLDTLMYVFNFADSAGFALVALDSRSDQLLAVTEKGSYTPGMPTGNPGFDLYVKCAEDYLTHLNNSPENGSGIGGGEYPEYVQKLITYTDVQTVEPLVTVAWGQDAPYNAFCPSGFAAGCLSVAIAQITTFHSFPSDIQLTFDGADIALQTLDWPAIRHHKNTNNCDASCVEHMAIAGLVREIGMQTNTIYGISSGAFPTMVPVCFPHFGYTSTSLIDYNFNQLVSSIKNKMPVYVRGEDPRYGGHGWVADGYKCITKTSEIWRGETSLGPWTLIEHHADLYDYVHFNWGWDGDNNGYFSKNSFAVNYPYELDPGNLNSQNYNFTVMLKMVTNIKPL